MAHRNKSKTLDLNTFGATNCAKILCDKLSTLERNTDTNNFIKSFAKLYTGFKKDLNSLNFGYNSIFNNSVQHRSRFINITNIITDNYINKANGKVKEYCEKMDIPFSWVLNILKTEKKIYQNRSRYICVNYGYDFGEPTNEKPKRSILLKIVDFFDGI